MVRKKLSRNFISWNRNWATVKRHLPVILKPTAAGLLAVGFWLTLLVPNQVHFSTEAKEPIMFIILPLVSFLYVIFASVAVSSVFDQYRKVSKSVVRKDVDTFLLYRDEQLPIMIHILIAAPSIILVAAVMLFNYGTEPWVGVASIFTVSFMLVLVWVIATELDDFSKSIWFREKIPAEWYEIDIDKHFSKK